MDDNNSQQVQEPTKQEKAEQTGKNTAELAAKGAATYFGGTAGAAIADKIAQTKLGQTALNTAGKTLAANPLNKHLLAQAQPNISNSTTEESSSGDTVNNVDSAYESSETSNSSNNSSFGNNKSGLFSSSNKDNNLSKKIKKIKTIATIAAISSIFILIIVALLAVVSVVMGQIMTVRDNIQKLAQEFTTGIEKFVNFVQGDGWMTEEDAFFDYLDKQYNLYSTNTGGVELDIPLIAATIHYSTTTDLNQYEKDEGKLDSEYIENDEFDQFGSILTEDQTFSFYNVAKDKLGSVNTIIPGQKRLLGHVANTKFVIVFVDIDVYDVYWGKFQSYFTASANETLSDIYWETPLSFDNPISLINTYNEMVSYYKQNRDAFAGWKYDYANKYYEVEEFMHYLKLSISSLFPETKSQLEQNEEINISGISSGQTQTSVDNIDGEDISDTEKYIPEQDRSDLIRIPVPYIVLEENYGYDEYKQMKQYLLEMKAILKEEGVELSSNDAIVDYAENSSDSRLRTLYDSYESVKDDYLYSYTHYLENLYIPFTYFYQQEYTESDIDIIIEEIYDQRDFYNYLIGEESDDKNNCGGSCIYPVGEQEINNLKVRLLQCSNGDLGEPIPGEELVDFEKYILGVVYAEIGPDAPAEAAKAQAIAARSFALTRAKEMGNSAGISLEKEDSGWVLSIRNCTEDQVYCDPDKGCSNTTDPKEKHNSTTVYSGANTKQYIYKGPLAEDAPIISAVSEVIGEVLLDEDGNIVVTGYTDVQHRKWAEQANQGMDYTEILLDTYEDARTISTSLCNNVCTIATGDYTQWKQYDSRWGSIKIIEPNICGRDSNIPCTIANVGCLATSVSIQIARSGVPLQNIDSEFNPGTFVEAIKPDGFTSSAGFIYESTAIVAPTFTYYNIYALTGTKTQKAQRIQELINEGCYVVLSVRYKGHYVAVNYVDGSDVYIMDPAANSDPLLWNVYEPAGVELAICYKVTG